MSAVDAQNQIIPDDNRLVGVDPRSGRFQLSWGDRIPQHAVCLFAGTMTSKSAGSDIFKM